jgi:serine/threonine protein kinase
MELFAHSNLMDFLHQKGHLQETSANKVFRQLVSLVASLHEIGIVHGNLREENILVDPHSLQVKLCEFFLAPRKKALNSDDILALGTILFSLVFCARPFANDKCTPSRLVQQTANWKSFWRRFSRATEISNELKDLLQQMLSHQDTRIDIKAVQAHEWLK